MSYEIVSSVVFALILFRIIEDGIDYVAGRIAKYQSDRRFKKLMERLEGAFPREESRFIDIGCDDKDCDICYDEPVAKKPVKRKPVKAQPIRRRPVKKAVAKKKK